MEGVPRGDHLVVDHAASERRLFEEPLEDGRRVGGGVGAHRGLRLAFEQMFGI
jgi:hypothetical protein